MEKKILIIEDEYDIASTMELALEMEGYEVRLSPDGRDGLKILSNEALPQLIICDIMMPIMDGYEFALKLREDSRYNHIPLILTSAAQLQKERLQENDIQNFLKKPFDLFHFLQLVDTTLKTKIS